MLGGITLEEHIKDKEISFLKGKRYGCAGTIKRYMMDYVLNPDNDGSNLAIKISKYVHSIYEYAQSKLINLMTREEKIEKLLDDKFDTDLYDYKTDTSYWNYCSGFRQGVKWADNHPVNIWHNASEKPENGKIILLEVVNTIPQKNEVRYFVEYAEEWIVNLMNTDGFQSRWAYISYLLPKEENMNEESKKNVTI